MGSSLIFLFQEKTLGGGPTQLIRGSEERPKSTPSFLQRKSSKKKLGQNKVNNLMKYFFKGESLLSSKSEDAHFNRTRN